MKNNIWFIPVFLILIISCDAQQTKSVFSSLSDALKNPANVKVLVLNGCNDLDTNILGRICKLSNLKELEISECPSVKGLPKGIGLLKNNLRKLTFHWNGGSGIDDWEKEFKKISHLENLEVLKLGPYNNIREIPTSVQKLKKLKVLDLRMTDVRMLPKEIGELHSLEILILSMTKIQEIPKELAKLPNLKKVYLVDTPISKNPSLKADVKKLLMREQVVFIPE